MTHTHTNEAKKLTDQELIIPYAWHTYVALRFSSQKKVRVLVPGISSISTHVGTRYYLYCSTIVVIHVKKFPIKFTKPAFNPVVPNVLNTKKKVMYWLIICLVLGRGTIEEDRCEHRKKSVREKNRHSGHVVLWLGHIQLRIIVVLVFAYKILLYYYLRLLI